ncbi:hypothetical protein [Umezawaea sp.]|uniref:hypothetical protein n=1 Tax=Umezawaea sp. TaxID=1955258 RepID=UPI002ED3C093
MARTKPVVPEPTANYPAQEHVELKRQVEEKFNATTAAEIADGWRDVGRQLTELAVDFSIIVNGSRGGWTGAAAERARSALAKVGSFSDATGEHFTSTGNALQQQTNAADEAKTRMPPPVPYDPEKMFADALASGSILQVGALAFTVPVQRAKSEAAKDEAVAVMRSRDDALRFATASMPEFAEVPSVIRERGVVDPTTTTSSVNTRTIDTSGGVGTTGVSGNADTGTTGSGIGGSGIKDGGIRYGGIKGGGVGDGTTGASWAGPPTPTPPPPSTPPRQNGQPAHFPGPQPPVARDPRTGRPLLPGGSGAGGGRTGNAGRPGTSGRAPTTGFGPTGSGFGPPGAAAPRSTTGRGRGTAAAAGGGASGGAAAGGGAGGARGEGGEDLEHQAKYLVPTDEHFGDNRMVSPPVIGG